MIEVMGIVLVIVACFIGGFGALFLKMGSGAKLSVTSLMKNWKLILGLLLYGVATAMFIPALKYGQLSVLYPLTSTTHVWVVIFSRLFLKENINIWKWIGIACIILGVTFLGFGG